MMQKICKKQKGFMAIVAVIMISSSVLFFSIVVMAHSFSYADMVYKKEYRLRKSLKLGACLQSLKIISEKDMLISGSVYMPEFECRGVIEKDSLGQKTFRTEYYRYEI